MDQLWIQIPWMSSVLQNKIVDQCERLQLQSATITKYVADVLPGKNQRAVVGRAPQRRVALAHCKPKMNKEIKLFVFKNSALQKALKG